MPPKKQTLQEPVSSHSNKILTRCCDTCPSTAMALSPLLAAVHAKHPNCVETLPVAPSDRETVDLRYRALCIAAQQDDTHMITALVKRGLTSVNAYNPESGTFPIMIAATSGCTNAVRTLMSLGCDINVCRSHQGDVPLQLAVREGHLETMVALLQGGADVNTTNHNGSTPLIRAVQEANLEAVHILIASGADVNTQNRFSSTALMCAIRNRLFPAVVALVDAGADFYKNDRDSFTALSVAMHRHNVDMMQLIIGLGCDLVEDVEQDTGHPTLFQPGVADDLETVHAAMELSAVMHASTSILVCQHPHRIVDVAEGPLVRVGVLHHIGQHQPRKTASSKFLHQPTILCRAPSSLSLTMLQGDLCISTIPPL